jgi:hypothetical protein
MQLFHNYIRPHKGLADDAPARRAGIEVKGDNERIAIIKKTSLPENKSV